MKFKKDMKIKSYNKNKQNTIHNVNSLCHICKQKAMPSRSVSITHPNGYIVGKLLQDCGTFILVQWTNALGIHKELFPKTSKNMIVTII